jgi:hypothetical protein
MAARSAAGTVQDPGVARRWQLQRHVQGILADLVPKRNRQGDEVAGYRYRVAMCHRGTDGGPVLVKRSPDGTRASFVGVQTCGSVWHCPLCAPKVAAGRRDELNPAIAQWVLGKRAKDGARLGGGLGENEVLFLTHTVQHDAARFGAGQLRAAQAALADALSYTKGLTSYRRALADCDAAGAVRALEVTYGEMNGWHVHTHEIAFVARGALVVNRCGAVVEWLSPIYRLRRIWARQLVKRGLSGLTGNETALERRRKLRHLLARCFVAQPGSYAADYLAKYGREPERERGQWGLASELTRAHLKRGQGGRDGSPQRCDHATPWALLNDAFDGDARSAKLFREFAVTFQGRRQLFWSPGLKALFGIAEQSDEDIAAKPEPRCTEPVIEITPATWGVVLSRDARFAVLRAAAEGGRQAVLDLLFALERSPPTHRGDFTETMKFYIPLRRAANG